MANRAHTSDMANLVKTMPELVRDQMSRATEHATQQFIGAVRAIYASSLNGTPIHVGSCLLIQWKGQDYLLTAAHIVDEAVQSNLYLGADRHLAHILGTFRTSSAPGGDRNKDHFDFAWLPLRESRGLANSVTERVLEQDLAGDSGTDGHYHVALGYPNSQNKKVDHQESSVTPRYMRYGSTAKPMPELCRKLGVSGREHLFLSHNRKHARDDQGQIVNALKPKGSSGGALIDMGNIADPAAFKEGYQLRGHLAGMLIEHPKHHEALVAVKIGVILGTIHRASSTSEAT